VDNGWGDDIAVKNDEEPKKPKLLNGRYLKIKKLGEGAFNVVYLATDLRP
jgi:hypothetical protein